MFGAGCFWGVEYNFSKLDGVNEVLSGYSGGKTPNPTYEQVCNNSTEHAEVVLIEFDESVISYQEFKKNCDEYFYLPHRKEPRGVGGIFFDHLNTGDWQKDFNFVKDVGLETLKIISKIVSDKKDLSWNNEDKEKQLIKRGRYVEFNLIWDRGTLFGLKTGGSTEAIMMSMPPEAKWD